MPHAGASLNIQPMKTLAVGQEVEADLAMTIRVATAATLFALTLQPSTPHYHSDQGRKDPVHEVLLVMAAVLLCAAAWQARHRRPG